MTLRSLAQELTEPHLKSIGGRIGKVPSLLSELRDAVSGSSDTGAGGSTSKQRILVNATALELLKKIDETIKPGYSDRFGQSPPTLETCVELIGKNPHEADWELWFTEKLEWAKQEIETMLRPKKLRRLDGITCPSCQQKVFGTERETCLYADCWLDNDTLLPPSEWSVECKGCTATWKGQKEMGWLLVALAPDDC
ncbi:DUF7341 domain-containing protein [Glutamicibacter sp.]|uniref:DUF7341 domain-containing protein n=1 Tax=Glutamicibacter sp. TaxID=1931995 RepID=UPI002B4937D5|nr:hypothetical protein [Glutamicibacter sp.]HJX77285.1 hypothetical protein [Glutamicibacter sp.]